MLFLLALCSTAVLSVRSESVDCSRPQCLDPSPEVSREYGESDDLLPSNEFFQKHCDKILKNLRCVQGIREACSTNFGLNIDVDLLVDSVVELCDEESAIRKAYVANVDCVNRINFTETCWNAYVAFHSLPMEVGHAMGSSSVKFQCILFHFFKPCAHQGIVEHCGEEAAQTATIISERARNIMECTDNDMDVIEAFLADVLNLNVGNSI